MTHLKINTKSEAVALILERYKEADLMVDMASNDEADLYWQAQRWALAKIIRALTGEYPSKNI